MMYAVQIRGAISKNITVRLLINTRRQSNAQNVSHSLKIMTKVVFLPGEGQIKDNNNSDCIIPCISYLNKLI